MIGRHAIVVATIVLAAVGLTGCAAATSDLSVGTSELMQSMVVRTADQAAAGDAAGAATTLDALQAQLDQGVASGDVSSDRASRIQQAIDVVRADLQPTPVVTPESTDQSPPAESVSPTVTDVPVTTVDPDETDDPATTVDPGTAGPGGDKGNGDKTDKGDKADKGDGKNGNGKN